MNCMLPSVRRYAPSAQVLFGEAGLEQVFSDPQIDLVLVVLPPAAAVQVRLT